MKIVVATDSFKGSLSATEVCQAIKKGILRADPACQVETLPIADGGEGTLEAMKLSSGGEMISVPCVNPLGAKIRGKYLILADGKTAVIEMAQAAGLCLIAREQQNPLYTTTYGVGEIILAALDSGYRKFIVCIGGSATVDAGIGMLQALGFRFLNKAGEEIASGGLAIANLRKIEVSGADKRLPECSFQVACDVDNLICGPRGAARVFAPQKGATPGMVEILEDNLRHFSEIVNSDLGIDISDVKGGGAAGGIGASLFAFLNAQLVSGVELVLDSMDFSTKLQGADLIITGEGQLDEQTAYGKVPMGVARRAKEKGLPVIALAGAIGTDYANLSPLGIDAAVSIVNRPMSLEEAMADAGLLLSQCSEAVIRLLKISLPCRRANSLPE
ncbi:MAG: glycerate kinase [Firmicutes bacterium]|nr:glycerate kinase [Bacillota bacterium]